jgi:hypothetical protein
MSVCKIIFNTFVLEDISFLDFEDFGCQSEESDCVIARICDEAISRFFSYCI